MPRMEPKVLGMLGEYSTASPVPVLLLFLNSHLSCFLGKGILPSVDNHDFVNCF